MVYASNTKRIKILINILWDNSGNYGFLMNTFSSKDILKNLSKANLVSISPLEMIVKNKNNQIKRSIAINEVSKDKVGAASLSVQQGSKQIIKN